MYLQIKPEMRWLKLGRKLFLNLSLVAALCSFAKTNSASAQDNQPPVLAPNSVAARLSSEQFVGQDGVTVERLTELGFGRRADLLAARQRLAIAKGRLQQAHIRPNPTLDTEYGSPRLLGGEPEIDFSVGLTQVFETGGKRRRRVAVAQLELEQARFEVTALERRYAAEIRRSYTDAIAAARQSDVLERLIAASEETLRATEARLKEGDVAPLDANLVRVENDRLRIQAIAARSDLETNLISLRTLVGAEGSENLRLAPQSDRPPRLELALGELTEIALRTRADLQAARIGEELNTARINLARTNRIPNVAASVRYSRNKGITDLPERLGGGDAIDEDNELTFGVSVEIPFFNRNQGEIAAATAEQGQARRNREFLEAAIRRDVAVAFRRYRAAAESLVLYSTQILPRSEENLRSIRAAYGFGEFSVLDVVAEQRRLTENVTAYNQSLRDYYNALTEIETTLGTTLPASSFAPQATSVLPDESLTPQRINLNQLKRSLLIQKKPNVFASTATANEQKAN